MDKGHIIESGVSERRQLSSNRDNLVIKNVDVLEEEDSSSEDDRCYI